MPRESSRMDRRIVATYLVDDEYSGSAVTSRGLESIRHYVVSLRVSRLKQIDEVWPTVVVQRPVACHLS